MPNKISHYLSLVKFSHTIFAMPFAITGFLLASSQAERLDWKLFIFVILCMVFARNAAMGFNRLIDRKIDRENERTAGREIPAGKITSAAAIAFIAINAALFMLATYFINSLCFYLSPVALLVILGYSLTKRFTALCHFVLGLGLSLAPIGAYLAVTGKFDILPLLLSFAVLFWTGGFDIIYALQDEAFDRNNNLNSVPAMLGRKKALLISRIVHLICFSFIISFGIIGSYGFIFWAGAAIFGSLLFYQQSIVKANDLSNVSLAFFTTNGVGSIVFGISTSISFFI